MAQRINNVGEGANAKYTSAFSALDRRMRAFDNFPASVRQALANAVCDWSIEQCHVMLHGGDPERKIRAYTPDALVALIKQNDAMRLRRA